ncbi:YitT family protein [Saccharibacillus brassicae]|uniref:YitT family protein n=1 Tax=Saccharibacillus brassicae TaxID=2583377 RepID=A0A4Y6UYN6_SACBS|nr:YitT family protein [Saccharibacillus brassicae]QDH21337.1 YitT family protein [Saccharibacillus brassicae]
MNEKLTKPPARKPSAPRAHHKRPFSQILLRTFFIIFGAVMVAVALELFLVPNNITDGGITGISVMASYLSGWKLGIFLFILNLPFLIVGYKQIGKTFALSTLLGITVLSIGTVLLHPVDAFVTDTLLAFVFGGIFLGVGTGIVIRNGGSLDGTEIIAILVSRKTPFSVGEIVMFVNLFILSGAGFVFGWDRALFSILAYYIAYKMIDVTIEGMNESKSVWIISDQIDDIGNAILDRLGRGVTYLAGEGGFTGDPKKVIFCVITRLEEAKLKEIVNQFDDNAFLAIGNIHDVKGGRFKKKDIH